MLMLNYQKTFYLQLNIRNEPLNTETLASRCASSLLPKVNMANASEYFDLANRLNAVRLEEKCLSLIML